MQVSVYMYQYNIYNIAVLGASHQLLMSEHNM